VLVSGHSTAFGLAQRSLSGTHINLILLYFNVAKHISVFHLLLDRPQVSNGGDHYILLMLSIVFYSLLYFSKQTCVTRLYVTLSYEPVAGQGSLSFLFHIPARKSNKFVYLYTHTAGEYPFL
jgi:hypothetical protein